MHWQFGGNLEPVQMICETDWKECPKAIASYVWSEIVTDVLDCLRNENIVWRVLIAFFLCIILLRIIYPKAKRGSGTALDKDILNKVGYKVEDLELKVNILTYKLQYGSWPLPHQVQKSSFRKNLRNLRLTLSNPNDRNNWIKHVLLGPKEYPHSRYYPSEYHLTELYAAKKKNMHPYLKQESLPVEYSSKSSKSSSDKSFKLNSLFKNSLNRKYRETSKYDNFEMQYRNTISLPLFSRRRNGKSEIRRTRRDSRNTEIEKKRHACKKFTRTMDDCKRYLRELHDSNKNLGLTCSSSEITHESSVKNVWSDLQQQRCVQQKDRMKLTDKLEANEEKNSEIINKNHSSVD
ncbi:uncharacterized protein LOC143424451 [Xylocopa sonorina]|uniref:uncharacterized protein LOC143424451 n=1 Tax=Xylocopa sonorina TaxID=1818115 RepID=UPI00403ADB56